MFIKVIMFIPLCVYSILDYYQTISLLECGMEEVNPVVLWIIGPNMNWKLLLTAKIVFLILLGLLLVTEYIQKRRTQ